jgi:hypothetical protein
MPQPPASSYTPNKPPPVLAGATPSEHSPPPLLVCAGATARPGRRSACEGGADHRRERAMANSTTAHRARQPAKVALHPHPRRRARLVQGCGGFSVDVRGRCRERRDVGFENVLADLREVVAASGSWVTTVLAFPAQCCANSALCTCEDSAQCSDRTAQSHLSEQCRRSGECGDCAHDGMVCADGARDDRRDDGGELARIDLGVRQAGQVVEQQAVGLRRLRSPFPLRPIPTWTPAPTCR